MLTIWTNFKLPPAALSRLQQGVGENRLLFAQGLNESVLSSGGADLLLKDADIAYGQPDPQQMIDLPNLKWIELTSAGYTRYDRDDLKNALKSRGTILTNSSSVFDEPCAEHALAMMLGLARQLPQCVANQLHDHKWKSTELIRPRSYLLNGQTAL